MLAFSQLHFSPNFSPFGMASESEIENYQELDGRFETEVSENGAILILEREEGWKTYQDFRLMDSVAAEVADFLGTKVYAMTNFSMPAKGLFAYRQKQMLNLKSKIAFHKSHKNLKKMEYAYSKFISDDSKFALLFIDSVGELSNGDILRVEHFGRNQCHGHFYSSSNSEYKDSSSMLTETTFIGLIALLLVLIAFYLITKSLKGLRLIGLVILFNVSLTFLFMFIVGISFNMSMIAVPCLIVVLSFSDLMHIFHHQAIHASRFNDDISLRKDIVDKIRFPMILTSITNMIGFVIYLIISENMMLTQLALVSIFGVVVAYLSSRYLVIPLMDKETRYIKRKGIAQFGSRLIQVSRWFQKRRVATIASVCLIFVMATIVFIRQFKVDLRVKNYISSHVSDFSAKKILSNHFFGSKSGEIFINWNRPNDRWTISHQKQIEKIEEEIITIFEPKHLTSTNSLVKRFSQISVNGNPNAYRLMKNLNPPDINPFIGELGGRKIVSMDRKMDRIRWGFADEGIPKNLEKFAKLNEKMSELNLAEGEFMLSGKSLLADNSVLNYSKKIIWGMMVAILITSIIILSYLKSVRLSVGTFLVNAVPLISCLILMLYSNVQINPQSLFLLSVLAGLCLDDSIYLMGYRTKNINELVLFPIFTTSVVLALAFVSLFFSSYTWLREFSYIFIIGILLAFILDVFIYPLFMNVNRKAE